jgi:hypothetical protein
MRSRYFDTFEQFLNSSSKVVRRKCEVFAKHYPFLDADDLYQESSVVLYALWNEYPTVTKSELLRLASVATKRKLISKSRPKMSSSEYVEIQDDDLVFSPIDDVESTLDIEKFLSYLPDYLSEILKEMVFPSVKTLNALRILSDTKKTRNWLTLLPEAVRLSLECDEEVFDARFRKLKVLVLNFVKEEKMPTIKDYLDDPLINDIPTREDIIRALTPQSIKRSLYNAEYERERKARLTAKSAVNSTRAKRSGVRHPPEHIMVKPGVMATALALMLKRGSVGFEVDEIVEILSEIFPKRSRKGLRQTVYLMSRGILPNGQRMEVVSNANNRRVIKPASVPKNVGKKPAADISNY